MSVQGAGGPQNLPLVGLAAGFRTPMGSMIQGSGRIAAYVRSGGVLAGDDSDIAQNIVTTLNAGLARCRSARGDIVVVLPEHTESISVANQMSNLVAGTRILGMGYGQLRPTFTWTATGSTFLFNVANVVLDNCILNLEPGTGTVSVGAPITISAAGCQISNCRMRTSTDASNLATIPITTTSGADDLVFYGNRMFGATAGECTTMFRLVGGNRLIMRDCYMEGATSAAAVGVVQCITTAAKFMAIDGCTFINRKASSSQAFTGLAAITGYCANSNFGVLDNATLTPFVTQGDLMGYNLKIVNLTGEQGAVATVVST